MSGLGAQDGSRSDGVKALAFYLPQFHPIPENDEWWGKGFTEWVNVAAARPLYPGHYQPHVPGELGYYDLRVPEVREAQADLARSHGISGFVYYHYWFQGRQLLERPFDEVLASGSPDFPFALCWANEEWTRNWDGQSGRVLIPQGYSDEDDLAHIRWFAKAFADERYITIDGRPLLLVYRPGALPDAKRTTDLWRAEARRLGFPDLYLCWVEGWSRPPNGPEEFGFDATVGFMPFRGARVQTPLEDMRPHRILDYRSAYEAHLRAVPEWRHFPSVMVGWDNTARYPAGATIFEGATPSAYRDWLERAVDSVASVREEENFLFVLAWNEWAEGNHLEPDRRHGRAFLEATREVMTGSRDVAPPEPGTDTAGDGRSTVTGGGGDGGGGPPAHGIPLSSARAVEHAVELLRTLGLGTGTRVVDASDTTDLGEPGPGRTEETGALLAAAGFNHVECVRSDVDGLFGELGDAEDIGAVVLVDLVARLVHPEQLLARLSRWSLRHGAAPVVVSAPNVVHVDLAVGALLGNWDESGRGPIDSAHVHHFTGASLQRLVERCGWRVVARNDVESVRSDAYDPALYEQVPEEMVGALRVLSETANEHWATEQFVWALEPSAVTDPPESFDEAVRAPIDEVAPPPDGPRPIDAYLASLGLVASETNRRAAARRAAPQPRWKQAVRRVVHATPGTSAAYADLRRRLG